MQETDEDYATDEERSTSTEAATIDSTTIDGEKEKDNDDETDNNRIVTRQSPRKKARVSLFESSGSPAPRRHSSRKIVNQTKSRITSMCK